MKVIAEMLTYEPEHRGTAKNLLKQTKELQARLQKLKQ